jgi:hypothetical protein
LRLSALGCDTLKKLDFDPLALGRRDGMDAHIKCEEHDTGAMSAEEGGWRYWEGDINIDMDDVSDGG